MGMKIECLVCLRETAVPKNLNTEKYDGQITCRECGALLQVKLVKAKVEQCKVVMDGKSRLSPPNAIESAKQAQKEGRFYLEEKS
jgi:transcription elongation factor Elf1